MSASTNPDACPISILMSLLSGPWTMYILWVLCNRGSIRFGALKRQVEGISTKMLTERLRMLEAAEIIYRQYEPTIPPQVTYGLTERGQELIEILHQLNGLAERWYGSEQREHSNSNV
ncbi:helix-turn-helix domain-containing protein [Nostoc sp. ChiSLP03a]|uniref:winged helix-turn-helix transcriptional regulator n=1 Tax=Nostoc sp. ChiSLP03a TaxID=3075380 RepID=UPI002AD5822D|nr:helix-turn-helix domain-containing protein [Nostoc sp. ChiSLP03a]MDZ8215771.1 helix-turn-helix domain-containing protein [Nostoc sp. ChiSLP03a]